MIRLHIFNTNWVIFNSQRLGCWLIFSRIHKKILIQSVKFYISRSWIYGICSWKNEVFLALKKHVHASEEQRNFTKLVNKYFSGLLSINSTHLPKQHKLFKLNWSGQHISRKMSNLLKISDNCFYGENVFIANYQVRSRILAATVQNKI